MLIRGLAGVEDVRMLYVCSGRWHTLKKIYVHTGSYASCQGGLDRVAAPVLVLRATDCSHNMLSYILTDHLLRLERWLFFCFKDLIIPLIFPSAVLNSTLMFNDAPLLLDDVLGS